ncbi:MAG: hypothetical protein CMM82_00130 [Rhodospirillales bacterium]|nr:hypothetical protein [Rhodospirillales bacterium]
MKLIIGASGAVGIPTIKNMIKSGHEFCVLSSNEESALKLRALGVVNVIVGDYREDGVLASVMRDVQSVCYIPARHIEDELEVGKSIVDAAKVVKLDHFLFCSAFQPQLQSLNHHWKKLLLEEYIIDSDLRATIVQPSMFMQNIRVEWPTIIECGEYRRPYSTESLMNVIDVDDLGEAIAKIMNEPVLQGATYQFSGDGPMSHSDMAKQISKKLGKKVKAIKIDIEDWKKWAIERGWTEYGINNYQNMCQHYDEHGYKYANKLTLTAILGREPLNFSEFIEKFAEEIYLN